MHSFVDEAGSERERIQVAGMVMQAITNARATVYNAKKSISDFNLRAGHPCAVGVELRGEDMYDFLAKVVEVVMPRVKDYRGVKGTSGDSSGNLSFAFTPAVVGAFPEVEVNYDA